MIAPAIHGNEDFDPRRVRSQSRRGLFPGLGGRRGDEGLPVNMAIAEFVLYGTGSSHIFRYLALSRKIMSPLWLTSLGCFDSMTGYPAGTLFFWASLISWKTLGRAGRQFVSTGPSRADIARFLGADALEPIRVYAGLNSAETAQDRVCWPLRSSSAWGPLKGQCWSS